MFQEKIDTIIIPIIGIDLKHFYSLFLYFLSGVLFYQFRKQLSLNMTGVVICGIGIFLIKLNLIPHLLFVFILPYLIFLLAFTKKINIHRAGQFGDFSYGIFLYSYPLQQLIVYFLQAKISVLNMIIISLVLTIPFAIISWRFIEKPALNLRQKLNSYLIKKLGVDIK
jgi:peptidoglycan/LPS O-acetylase OafA/YrhL